MPDTLVVYYSRTGHTEEVAEELAESLGADLDVIEDFQERTGVRGYVRSGLETVSRFLPRIRKPQYDPANYRRVIVGGPIWNSSISTPVRTYLIENRNRLPETAFFVTYGGIGARRAFKQMERFLGRSPLTTMAFREGELGTDIEDEKVMRLVNAITKAPKARARKKPAAKKAA
jgi:menaquinone-dependent protoporphyrinogen IX oxidase